MKFSLPSNWCDRRCLRCSLVKMCEEGKQTLRRRWALEARGQDPDGGSVRPSTAPSSWAPIAEEKAPDEPDVDDAEMASSSSPPINLLARRLEELAIRYTDSVSDLLNQLPDEVLKENEAVEQIVDNAVIIGGKVGRVTATVEADGMPQSDTFWEVDSVPNLLLLEELSADTDEQLLELTSNLDPDAYAHARDQLFRGLSGFYDRVPNEARNALKELIQDELAPSPFVTMDLEEEI